MKKIFTSTLASAVLTTGLVACGEAGPPAATTKNTDSATPAQTADTAAVFAGYDTLLREHVDDLGFVDYDALAASPQTLSSYVESLAAPTLFEDQSRDAKLATLINAYNAFTLQLILDHYDNDQPPNSITDLYGGKPWDQKIWNLAGQTVSLNQLEHEMIRAEFPEEPRIHWAVVCAAYSCPPLRAEAYTAADLESQLTDQEHRVLLAGDTRFVKKQGDTLGVTQLFNWYGSDFGDDWKTYLRERLSSDTTAHSFLDYNWDLNSQPNRPKS
ncbi:MAG: DUF547 domain-containing protein [Planctomycetota bacterium]